MPIEYHCQEFIFQICLNLCFHVLPFLKLARDHMKVNTIENKYSDYPTAQYVDVVASPPCLSKGH